MAVAVSLVALFTATVVVRTGFLGGKIRHTEIDNPPAVEYGGH